MKRTDTSASIAISTSLVVHAILALMTISVYIQQADEFARNGYTYRWSKLPTAQGLVVLPVHSDPLVMIPPETIRPADPPLPPYVVPPPPDVLDRFLKSQWGEEQAQGTAIKSSPGDEPLAGREGRQDQPWLSLDPVGPAIRPREPSPYTGLPGDNGNGGRMTLPGSGGAGPAARPGAPAGVALSPAFRQPAEPPNTPFGAPAPPLPPVPKLVARPPIRDFVAEAPEKPDSLIGQARPVPRADPSVVEGHSEKPNQLLVDAQSKLPTTLPAVVVRTRPNDLKPEIPVDDPAKVTPPDMPRELAVLETLLRPTTRKSDADRVQNSPGATEEGVGNVSAKGPTTRPADALAMRHPDDRPNDATVDKTKEATPTTLPVGEQMRVKSDFKPELKRNDREAKPETPIQVASSATPGNAGVENPGPGGDPAAGNGRPGAPLAPADPAPQTDSESDPFLSAGSVRFRAGKIEAQLGRKFKPIRARLTLKGEMDVISMGRAVVVLRASIDRDGKVTDVKVVQSSGSNEIDLPVAVALYKWWIEPPKDRHGNPRPDVMLLTIGYE